MSFFRKSQREAKMTPKFKLLKLQTFLRNLFSRNFMSPQRPIIVCSPSAQNIKTLFLYSRLGMLVVSNKTQIICMNPGQGSQYQREND